MSIKVKQTRLVSRETIARFLQTAGHAAGRGDLKEALVILEGACSLAPGNPEILLQLGRIHGLNFNYAAAESCFLKAVHFSNQKTVTLRNAGAYAYEFYNLELAERFLRLATKQKDSTAESWVGLARFLENARQLPESAQCLEKAYILEPSYPEIPLVRARLERQANHLGEAEKLLRSIPRTTDLNLRVEYVYELASVLDRQGRYGEAMDCLHAAKAPFQAHEKPFRLRRESLFTKRKKVLAGMTAATLQRWSDIGAKLIPARRLALISGHPRSGTTLLEQVLDSHRDIVAAEETKIFHQEVYVPLANMRLSKPDLLNSASFSSDPVTHQLALETLDAVTVDSLRRLRENYFCAIERCLGQPTAGRLVVDKNPMLSMLINGFPRVFPEAKLLVALRDPRDVCLSCFSQHLASSIDMRRTAYFNLTDIVEQYVQEMAIWRTLAPMMEGRYLEVRYEDMVEDLESVARKTLDFLGVPWDPIVLRFHEQAQQKLTSHGNYVDVSKPVYNRARQRWRNYEKFFEPYQEKLAPFVKAFGYD